MRWCPGCQRLTGCHDDRETPCSSVALREREHQDALVLSASNANAIGESYASTQNILEEDLRIAVNQGLNALAKVKSLEARVDQLLAANSHEVEKRREVERDKLIQETIVAALADRCVLVERQLKRS